MEKIIKFESFTLKNLSDLENWSSNYIVNKEKGILPYLKTKISYSYPNETFYWENKFLLD